MLLGVKSVACKRIKEVMQETARNGSDLLKAGPVQSMQLASEQGVYERLLLEWKRPWYHYI